jgi:ATP/maltotriose-dependent transcriptional regulator MalT
MLYTVFWARAQGLTGSLVEIEAEAEEFHRRVPVDKTAGRALAAVLLGRAALSRGHVQRARHFLREAVMRASASGAEALLPWALSGLAQSAALAGDLPAAERALRDTECQSCSGPAHDLDLTLSRAWVVAARGEVGRAAALAIAAADTVGESRNGEQFAALALHDAGRLGASLAVADRLAELAARGDSRLLRVCTTHTAARRDGDAGGLVEAAGQFEALGADLRAAEAWTQAAAAHQARGRPGPASVAGGRAQACLDRCEGARTPGLIPQEILAPSLTRRQREVAGLVALGLSNREVAGKLYVSLRTVENHLYQVYAKLDVVDRRDLARRLCAPVPA